MPFASNCRYASWRLWARGYESKDTTMWLIGKWAKVLCAWGMRLVPDQQRSGSTTNTKRKLGEDSQSEDNLPCVNLGGTNEVSRRRFAFKRE